jgi:heme-degrading monooxygenase HmoA
MYGTIARMLVRPDADSSIDQVLRAQVDQMIPGHIATYVFRSDHDPHEFHVGVLFESRAAYAANAESPEQDARFRELRNILAADPEWHDGEVVYQQVTAAAV